MIINNLKLHVMKNIENELIQKSPLFNEVSRDLLEFIDDFILNTKLDRGQQIDFIHILEEIHSVGFRSGMEE